RRFVHVPAKPGGTLGLLDTLSSVALFMTFGHLFFTASRSWWELVAYSALSLILGLALFAYRQRLAPDDGFLAVSLYSLKHLFLAEKVEKQPGETQEQSSTAIVEKANRAGVAAPLLPPTHVPQSTSTTAKSSFWGPALRRFGVEATEG